MKELPDKDIIILEQGARRRGMNYTEAIEAATKWTEPRASKSAYAFIDYQLIRALPEAQARFGFSGVEKQLICILSNLGGWKGEEAREAKATISSWARGFKTERERKEEIRAIKRGQNWTCGRRGCDKSTKRYGEVHFYGQTHCRDENFNNDNDGNVIAYCKSCHLAYEKSQTIRREMGWKEIRELQERFDKAKAKAKEARERRKERARLKAEQEKDDLS